jgi:hypothetical protein
MHCTSEVSVKQIRCSMPHKQVHDSLLEMINNLCGKGESNTIKQVRLILP